MTTASPAEIWSAIGGRPVSTAAQVVYEVSGDVTAPLRVPVGPDALGVVQNKGKECEESAKYAEKWNHIFEAS